MCFGICLSRKRASLPRKLYLDFMGSLRNCREKIKYVNITNLSRTFKLLQSNRYMERKKIKNGFSSERLDLTSDDGTVVTLLETVHPPYHSLPHLPYLRLLAAMGVLLVVMVASRKQTNQPDTQIQWGCLRIRFVAPYRRKRRDG